MIRVEGFSSGCCVGQTDFIFFATSSSKVALSVGQSTKIYHSLIATVFALGGWNVVRRSSVCVCVCVCVFMPICKKEAGQWEWPVTKRA